MISTEYCKPTALKLSLPLAFVTIHYIWMTSDLGLLLCLLEVLLQSSRSTRGVPVGSVFGSPCRISLIHPATINSTWVTSKLSSSVLTSPNFQAYDSP